jgi:hypothetical protein
VTAQPIFEQRCIGNGCLSKTSQRTDFGTVPFGRSALPGSA